MEQDGALPSSRARRPEPSWPTVIATTVRLWLERHPVRARRLRVGGMLALAGVLAVGAAVAISFAVIGRGTAPPAAVPRRAAASPAAASAAASAAISPRLAAAARGLAAGWVADQVASSAIVACDPAMCAALRASGVPAGRLLVLGPRAIDPLGSDVVVATPALRGQFGARLDSGYAPAVLASFGSGAARIDVRAVAPGGVTAYAAAFTAAGRARGAAGRELLRNRRVWAAPGVRAALRAGEADPRLLSVLAALAARQPVRILALGDPSPGVSLAVPFRSAEIAPQRAGARIAARLRAMLSFLWSQQPPYLPMRTAFVHEYGLTVEYAAPSPLGLPGRP